MTLGSCQEDPWLGNETVLNWQLDFHGEVFMAQTQSLKDYLMNHQIPLDSYMRAKGLVLSAFDIYLAWSSEMAYEAEHFDLLFLKEEFGKAFGPWVELALIYGIYSHRLHNDTHGDYFERGEASGDGGEWNLAHDPAIPQHKRMIALFEQLSLQSLPRGQQILDIMRRFKPQAVEDPAHYGRWTFQSTPDLKTLDEQFLEACSEFEIALDEKLNQELGLSDSLRANNPPIIEATDFYDLWNGCVAFFNQGDMDSGARNLETILRSRPRYVPAMMHLAIYHLDAGRLDRAADYMKQVIDLNPEPTLMKEYVSVLHSLGRTQEAAEVIAHAQKRTGSPLSQD